MASQVETDRTPRLSDKDGTAATREASEMSRWKETGRWIHLLLEPLASLKITVTLFALSILLILAGTLAQVKMDVNEVVSEYFRPWFIWIDLDIFAPKQFFPDKPDIPWSVFFPGGALIGTALFLNLFAAHAIRFKVQARGGRLWAGLGMLGIGVLITWLVIASGSNPDGFQTEPLVRWETLWEGLKYALGALWVGMASSLLKIDSARRLERWTLIGLTVLLGAGVVLLFWKGDAAQFDEKTMQATMRILWQLIKGTFAAGALLVACYLLFRKRAGVVLLHAGVGLLMFSELYVSLKNHEAQMTIREGETINYVQDGRSSELAVIDRSLPDKDIQTVVPASRLETAVKTKGRIRDEKLPFDIAVHEWYPNSELRVHFDRSKRGAWKYRLAKAVEKGTGASSESTFDMPSAIIELFDKKSGNSLGQYLVSAHLEEQEILVDGKKYEIALRFKRTYKPYSLHLIDARGDKYIGTEIAKNYSSQVKLVDKSRGIERDDVHIWMNNPLRYAGETFYQQNYGTMPVFYPHVDPETGLKTGIRPTTAEPELLRELFAGMREYTTFQVVTNSGWMIPYVACMIVAVGMLAHFWIALLRFLNRRAAGRIETVEVVAPERVSPALPSHRGLSTALLKKKAADIRDGKKTLPAGGTDGGDTTGDGKETSRWSTLRRASVWFPAAVCLLLGGWLAGRMMVRPVIQRGMNLYEFGKLPVVSHARLKPFDSLARNNLRAISGRETFKDEKGQKQPAIVWLINCITRPDVAARYHIFRIENLDVLDELGLGRRSGFRYSLNEVLQKENRRKIDAFARKAQQKNRAEEPLSLMERKFVDLRRKIRLYEAIQRVHVIPPADVKHSHNELIRFVLSYNEELSFLPLAVPNPEDKDRPWLPLANASGRYWIRQFAKANGLQTLREVFTALVRAPRDSKTQELLDLRLKMDVFQKARQMQPDMSEDQLRRLVFLVWDRLTPQQKESRRQTLVLASLNDVMENQLLSDEDPPQVVALVGILAAHRDGKAEAFNAGVLEYRRLLEKLKPEGYSARKLAFETWFNTFSPYVNLAALYLTAFVLTVLAWLGWTKPLNRAAFGLVILAFFVHTMALIARMYISGRWGVTVTNLYSSAVFIGWGACLAGLVLESVYRLGIGNVIASLAGFSTLLIAHYLSFDGDTISVMQAVLDTSFWLATHVTTITLGYAATYVAGLLGLIYVVGGVFTPALSSKLSHGLYRMMYGTLCFAIFFSFVGTVLGGLWADDSWGRFWGWDPKENGALIIVLWNALVLHARWGGLVKERGTAVLAIVGNIVTSWSWFGVNLLSVGLHSYGFQEGTFNVLAWFCLSQLLLVGLGCLPKEWWLSFRHLVAKPLNTT